REIAIIMRVLLGAHFFGDTRDVVPAPRGLHQLAAVVQGFDLARNFIFERLSYAAEAVHVLDLDLGAEFIRPLRPHAHVHVATHHPLLDIAITYASVSSA